MTPCRECQHEISEQAQVCPNCGAPFPARRQWTGWGYEFKSSANILGLPLLHISFKFGSAGRPVPAKGVIAIGQFGMGVVNISQFGIGVVSLGQFTIAGWALAQFGVAWELIAQAGLYVHAGRGQMVAGVFDLLQRLG